MFINLYFQKRNERKREFRPAEIRVHLHKEFRAAEIRFYLHKEFRAAEIRFSLHKEFRAAEIRFYLHKRFRGLFEIFELENGVYIKTFSRCAGIWSRNPIRKTTHT